MKRRLSLILPLVFLMTFLVFPSVTYTENTGGCSDNPYANCAPARKMHLGELLGGKKYLKESYNQGSFLGSDGVVQNASVTNGEYYEDNNQYFKPLLAITGAVLASILVAALIYFSNTKKSKQKR